MSQGKRLVEAMLTASRQKQNEIVDLIVGTVTSVEPLKVKVDKIELTESFLIVGALCKETIIKIPNDASSTHTHKITAHTTQSAGDPSHTHSISELTSTASLPSIKLWRGLKVGDVVYMIKVALGQKYFILQREEGVTNDS